MSARCWLRRTRRNGWMMMVMWVVVLVLVVVMMVATIKPVRNAFLYPVWPDQWRPVGSYRLLERHLVDFFSPLDRLPYRGSCQRVRDVLHDHRVLEKARAVFRGLHSHSQQQWSSALRQLKPHTDTDTLRKLARFKPALTDTEQRTLMRDLFVLTSALDAFNVTYMAAAGTLIGLVRFRGLLPWDDDADLVFPVDQWEEAKRVLSCVPGYELKIRSDLFWKFYALDSPLWTGEQTTHFHYIDLFPYVADDKYVWPVTIWLKDRMVWEREKVFPTRLVNFENFQLRVPYDVTGVLANRFGDISVCEARLFERREKRTTTPEERVRVNCSLLFQIYTLYRWRQGADTMLQTFTDF